MAPRGRRRGGRPLLSRVARGRQRPHALQRHADDALAAFARWLGEVPPVSLAEYPETLARALPGDLAYLDPPYEGTFDGYFGKRFKTDDLVREVRGAELRGVLWAMSNSAQARWAVDFPGAAMLIVDRAGTFSGDAADRGTVAEALVIGRALPLALAQAA